MKYALLLCNALGTPVDTKYIDMGKSLYVSSLLQLIRDIFMYTSNAYISTVKF